MSNHGTKTMNSKTVRTTVPALAAILALGCLAALPQAVQAQNAQASPSVYVQGSQARRDTDVLTIGATLPWKDWQRPLWGGQLTGYWDIYASRWSYDGLSGQREHLSLVGVTPTLRLRMDEGRSAWFWEGGIGLTVADKRYEIRDRTFSTRANFASHLGLGVSLGQQRQHDIVLRVQHVSNAGIKKPNPGENFVQLRYGYHF
jgi:lipid A 3-O-deacylase